MWQVSIPAPGVISFKRADMDDKAKEALRKHFGFEGWREGQAEVIEAALEGRDVVAVMPTGGGKSLCYQLPAMIIDGATLVISPLIALMKDQVDQLSSRGIPSTFINSSLGYSEIAERIGALRSGRYKLIYVAPERFRSRAFTSAIAQTKIGMLAVDEAHCISLWGHDFRPDYLKLREVARALGRPQIMALTATATPQVRSDIIALLELRDPSVFVAGFDRPNLSLSVIHTKTEREKFDLLDGIISRSTGAGIIYAATRKGVERIAARLKVAGYSVEAYHGRMEDGQRARAQDLFMSGALRAIVATNAFGMGIDKPDIRFVVHFQMPSSIEAYYQEIGRAGRDGLPADCALFFNYADTHTQQFFIEGSHPPPELIYQVYDLIVSLGSQGIQMSARELASHLGAKNELAVDSALAALERAGHIERGRAGDSIALAWLRMELDEALQAVPACSLEAELLRDLIFNRNLNDREAAELDLNAISSWMGISIGSLNRAMEQLASLGIISYRKIYHGRGIRLLDEAHGQLRVDFAAREARAAAERWKLRRMVDYCYWRDCLRAFILDYFGDRKRLSGCGNCSNCARWTRPGPSRRAPKAIVPHQPSLAARKLVPEEIRTVKQILSCVARLNARFGKGTIAAVLRGSTSKQILEGGLDRLPNYGSLKTMKKEELNAYIKALIRAGCISVSQGPYPTLSLSHLGRRVLEGRAEIALELPL
jgi:ATP-dependent DNA helicase RecQ